MPLLVYTAQYRYDGADRLDITRKGASPENQDAFAPTWKLVNWGKSQLANARSEDHAEWIWLAYRARYTEAMRASYKRRKKTWDELLARERAVLVCFCSDPNRCHRRVLAEILAKLGATDAGEVPVDHRFEH